MAENEFGSDTPLSSGTDSDTTQSVNPAGMFLKKMVTFLLTVTGVVGGMYVAILVYWSMNSGGASFYIGNDLLRAIIYLCGPAAWILFFFILCLLTLVSKSSHWTKWVALIVPLVFLVASAGYGAWLYFKLSEYPQIEQIALLRSEINGQNRKIVLSRITEPDGDSKEKKFMVTWKIWDLWIQKEVEDLRIDGAWKVFTSDSTLLCEKTYRDKKLIEMHVPPIHKFFFLPKNRSQKRVYIELIEENNVWLINGDCTYARYVLEVFQTGAGYELLRVGKNGISRYEISEIEIPAPDELIFIGSELDVREKDSLSLRMRYNRATRRLAAHLGNQPDSLVYTGEEAAHQYPSVTVPCGDEQRSFTYTYPSVEPVKEDSIVSDASRGDTGDTLMDTGNADTVDTLVPAQTPDQVSDEHRDDLDFSPGASGTVDSLVRDAWGKLADSDSLFDTSLFLARRGYYTWARYVMKFVPYDSMETFADMPVFLSGPHGEDAPDLQNKKAFGKYNPAFIEWAADHLIPAQHDMAFRKLTQPLYDTYLRTLGRAFYLSYFKIKQNYTCFREEVAAYQKKIDEGLLTTNYKDHQQYRNFLESNFCNQGYNYSDPLMETYFISIIPFWMRRHLDGTEDEFVSAVKTLLQIYDPSFVDLYPLDN